MARLAPTVLVAGLLVATATAFAVSERLKLEESPVLGTRIRGLFSPVCTACPAGANVATIRFRLRREEDIRLDVTDSGGTVVRHGIASGVLPPASHEFAWDGRDDTGRVVKNGIYRAELRLLDENRTVEFPDDIRVDSTPPVIEDVKPSHTVFSPDGDGRADRVDLSYRFSEPAYAVLYLDGRKLTRSHTRRPTGTIQWYGLRDGRGLPPGKHRLALAAQDLAGNLAPSTREFTVRIRYVALHRSRFVVRGRHLRVRVSTDATAVRWRLAGRAGVARMARAHVLTIAVPSRPGRYRLVVVANGRVARATVVVRRASR